MAVAELAGTPIEYLGPDRPLYPKQREAIFSPERYAIIEASTKSGKTVGCLIWLAELAFKGRPGQNFWWVAPVYAQAKDAYRRLKDEMLPSWLYTANDSELFIKLVTGGTIWFKTGEKPDHLFGADVYAAVLDEATRMKEEAFFAVRSTLTATRGPIRIIGNVKGRKNWVYKMARLAEAGEPDMSYALLTADDAIDAGILDKLEVQDARRRLPEDVFLELYMAQPSDDAGNPFGLRYIAACIRVGLAKGPAKAFGWDLAKSLDWTVGVGLNEDRQVCEFVRFQKPWQDTIPAIILANGKVPALVDSTGVGDPVLEFLQKQGGPHFEGFKFSKSSKQQLLEGLAVSIQNGEIEYPDGPIPRELELIEYEYYRGGVRYSAPEGFHDDCVMGLALADQKFRSIKPLQIFL